MKTVLLRSGYAMPMIGFGTWTLRGEACAEAVKTALLTGYRLIDKDAVSEGIRRAGIPREELFLTTKVCAPADSYEGTKEQIRRSLARLGTDYIDLFLIHEPYRAAPAMWRAMTEARAEGKLRALGVSNFSARELRDFIGETGEVPAVDQAESHVFCPRLALAGMEPLRGREKPYFYRSRPSLRRRKTREDRCPDRPAVSPPARHSRRPEERPPGADERKSRRL